MARRTASTTADTAGVVTFRLAHPLRAVHARVCGLGDADIPVGTEVSASVSVARSLINAGYVAGVDPQDREAVAAALTPADATSPVDSAAG